MSKALPRAIGTDRLELVYLELSELDALRESSSDASLLAHHGWSNPDQLFLGEEAWLPGFFAGRLREDPANETWTIRAIIERDDRAIVGHIGAHRAPGPDRTVEVGYTVAPSRRRRAIGTEALVGLVDAIDASGAADRVIATTTLRNTASIALARKAGFAPAGILWSRSSPWISRRLERTLHPTIERP